MSYNNQKPKNLYDKYSNVGNKNNNNTMDAMSKEFKEKFLAGMAEKFSIDFDAAVKRRSPFNFCEYKLDGYVLSVDFFPSLVESESGLFDATVNIGQFTYNFPDNSIENDIRSIMWKSINHIRKYNNNRDRIE